MPSPTAFPLDEVSANSGARARTHDTTLANAGRSDGLLAGLARAGDRDAFAELVERHMPRIRAFLFRLSRRPQDLDDLTQDTFVIAISQLSQLREPERFGSWLFGIAYRVCQGARRRWNAGIPGFDSAAQEHFTGEPFTVDAATPLERADEARVVWDAIGRLGEPQRDAFLLRQVEELGPDEAAAILGVPSGTARRWYFEAREELRKILTAGARRRGADR